MSDPVYPWHDIPMHPPSVQSAIAVASIENVPLLRTTQIQGLDAAAAWNDAAAAAAITVRFNLEK
jgi:hypothetical protein